MVGVDFDPTTARGQTAKQSWIGAGDFFGSMAVTLSPVSYLAYVPGVSETQMAQFIQDRHHTAAVGAGSMVGWDEGEAAAGGDGWHTWREDPVAAATESVLNIGSFFIPGAGLAAGGGKLATGAARAGRGGRGGKHLKTAPGGTDVVTPGGKSLSGENSTVFTGGSKVSQARTDAVADVDLTPDHGPGTRGAGSETGRGDSNANQSSTARSHGGGSETSGATPSGAPRTEANEPAGNGSTAGSRPGAESKVADSGTTGTRAGDPDALAARAGVDADVREPSMAGQGRKDAADGGSDPALEVADEARGAGGTSKGASETWRAPEVEQHVTWQDRVGPKQTFPPGNAVLEANTAYEVPDRGTYYTDGTGTVTHVETGYSPTKYPNPDLNHPAPNTTYVVDDRHVFVTDGKSRTVEVHVPDVEQAAARRSGHIQGEVGRAAGPGHDGAHLIQNALGGGRERINIVGMLEELNRSGSKKYGSIPNSYYRMEADLRAAVMDGKDVSLDLYVQYGDGKTPVSIEAEYSVEGIWKREKFINVR